jgi:hypothetical protein
MSIFSIFGLFCRVYFVDVYLFSILIFNTYFQ